MDKKKKCLLKLTENSLIVANTGQPFSRLGVISICASHRGTKKRVQPVDLFGKWPDSNLPVAIQEKEIETYLSDKNRLFDDYNHETEISHDYGGRFLWELLQNADDAMSPIGTPPTDMIGIKGLGFKSVLEISKKPTIYSDPFHFYFSASDSQRLMQAKGISKPPPLTFRIPHNNPNIEDIIDLVDEFPTIICLPFADEVAKNKVSDALENLSEYFVTLCQYIQKVQVVWPNGRNRLWKIKRNTDGELKDGDISVQVIEDGSVLKKIKYRRWANIWNNRPGEKRHSVAICLPIDSKNRLREWEGTLPLYSFFPTEEHLPFKALLHASFDLDQSRKHVRDPDNKIVLDKLDMLLNRILKNIPARVSLKAFFPQNKPVENKLSKKMWDRFESVLQRNDFVPCIGGMKVIPKNARLWEYNLGNVLRSEEEKVAKEALVLPDLLIDDGLRKALESLGAELLENPTYLSLLKYCNNETLKDCINALKVFSSVLSAKQYVYPNEYTQYINAGREIPCWYTNAGKPRSLSDKLPLLRKELDIEVPEWISCNALDPEVLKCLIDIEENGKDDLPSTWGHILSGILLKNSSDDLLHNLLLPIIQRKNELDWWNLHGGEVLNLFQLWTKGLKFTGSPVAIWNDNRRKKLGQALFLPTENGWLPSWQCYAGSSWGGPASFDSFFADKEKRGVLIAPERWPVKIDGNRNNWEKILCYVGVSWEMKLICKSGDGYNGWKITPDSGSWEIECPFPMLRQKDYWSDYLLSLVPPSFYQDTVFDFDSRVHKQWGIEFFPEALPEKAVERVMAVKSIAKEAIDSVMEYTYQKGGGYDGRNEGKIKSFAAWQIKDYPWMPCKKSLLDKKREVPPGKAYMPGKGIGGLLPELNITIADGQTGRDVATFLTQTLEVRETLPLPGETIWMEWIERLPAAAQRTEDQSLGIRITRVLYRSFYNIHDEKPEWLDVNNDIPSLRWNLEGKTEKLEFKPPNNVFWLDEPYLAEPNTRTELLRRFNIFILEQEYGKKASGWCNLTPLSELIHVKPHYDNKDHDTTDIVRKRYRERYNALKVASGMNSLPEPDNLKILAVDNLRLRIMMDKERISAPKVRNWMEDGLVLIDSQKKWEALGLSLVQKKSKKNISYVFENLLQEEHGDEVLQRLRDLGVPESALEDLEADFQTELANQTSRTNGTTVEAGTYVRDAEKPEVQDTDDGEKTVQEHHKGASKVTDEGKGQTKEPMRSGKINQSRQKKGKDAENWIRTRISDLLSLTDWAVSIRPERDSQNRESDIVLSHQILGKYHIEVKHIEAGMIYWTEKEVSKAIDNTNNYWMVLMRPGYATTDDNIIWFWDPLKDLKKLPRHGRWLWRTEKNAVGLDAQDWIVPKPRGKADANNFTFVIEVNDEFLRQSWLKAAMGFNWLRDRLTSTCTSDVQKAARRHRYKPREL